MITDGVTGFAVTVTRAAGSTSPVNGVTGFAVTETSAVARFTGSGVTGFAVTVILAGGIGTNPPGAVNGRVNHARPRRRFGRIRDRNTRGRGAGAATAGAVYLNAAMHAWYTALALKVPL